MMNYLSYHPQVFSSIPGNVPQHNLPHGNLASRIPANHDFHQSAGYRQEGMTYQYALSPLHTIPPLYNSTEQSATYMPLQDSRKGRSNQSKEVSLAVLSRRRAQNRASQRAYRNRKDAYIQSLETRLSEVKGKYEELVAEHKRFTAEYEKVKRRMREEVCANERLKDGWRSGYLSSKSPENSSQKQSVGSSDEQDSHDEGSLGVDSGKLP